MFDVHTVNGSGSCTAMVMVPYWEIWLNFVVQYVVHRSTKWLADTDKPIKNITCNMQIIDNWTSLTRLIIIHTSVYKTRQKVNIHHYHTLLNSTMPDSFEKVRIIKFSNTYNYKHMSQSSSWYLILFIIVKLMHMHQWPMALHANSTFSIIKKIRHELDFWSNYKHSCTWVN